MLKKLLALFFVIVFTFPINIKGAETNGRAFVTFKDGDVNSVAGNKIYLVDTTVMNLIRKYKDDAIEKINGLNDKRYNSVEKLKELFADYENIVTKSLDSSIVTISKGTINFLFDSRSYVKDVEELVIGNRSFNNVKNNDQGILEVGDGSWIFRNISSKKIGAVKFGVYYGSDKIGWYYIPNLKGTTRWYWAPNDTFGVKTAKESIYLTHDISLNDQMVQEMEKNGLEKFNFIPEEIYGVKLDSAANEEKYSFSTSAFLQPDLYQLKNNYKDVIDAYLEEYNSLSEMYQNREKIIERLRNQQNLYFSSKIDSIKNKTNNKILEEIREHVIQSTRTDYDGSFSFKNISPGEYYIFLQYETGYTNADWLYRINTSNREMVKLSNYNMIPDLFF